MKVPLVDVAASNAEVLSVVLPEVSELAKSGRFVLGAPVEAFERACQEFLGVREVIGVSSGSDALVCALLALGVGPGDEVLTTPFSFFATVEGILRVGAKPHFVDIRPDTYELDFEAVEAAIGPNTRGILSAHLYGQPGSVEQLGRLSEQHGLFWIEDAAQAFGATRGGQAAGSFGTLGCFSFHPTKPLGGWGDSGLVVTNDAALAERCRRLRTHGAFEKHCHEFVGGNYRMDALQASVLSQKLPRMAGWLAARRAHALAYDRGLSGLEGLTTPVAVPAAEPSYALYTVRVGHGQRERLREHLSRHGVETAVHYPVPIHRQKALLEQGCGAPEGSLPEAERAAREVLCLPVYPELSVEQRQYVVDVTRRFFERV